MKRFICTVMMFSALAVPSRSASTSSSLKSTPVAPQNPAVAKIRLPERFRLLTDQLFDLRVEASALESTAASIKVFIDNVDVTASLPVPEVTTNNDADISSIDKAWTFRGLSFSKVGTKTVRAVISDGANSISALQRIGIQEFKLHGNKNIILFLGDAMGTAYRDASRIVAMSAGNRLREGFFDELQQMDQMPVSGMVMTYALDRIVPDSANTGTAWCTGNKTIDGALGVFPDNTDFKFNGANDTTRQATKQFALDNPRIETLWEYLKRRYGYATGIVTTADVTDATPAAEGSHTISRTLGYDIAKQFVDGVFTTGYSFDVILGGGKERFVSRTVANSGDTRNLATELQAHGFTYVQTRTELNALPNGATAPDKLIGLFRTGNMNVAYDKLGLTRPVDEPTPDFGGFNNQPFLDEMTAKAIASLNKGNRPFILMVEGASIDKQSHPNHAAGTIWDTIEFDKAVGVGRQFALSDNPGKDKSEKSNTLVLVTADHDQSMSVIGVNKTRLSAATPPLDVLNTRSNNTYPIVGAPAPPANTSGLNNAGEVGGFPNYSDSNGDGYPENQDIPGADTLRLAVGFRTGNHTGSSVPITAEGPGALLFTGYYDQTDIFFKMARALSSNTKSLDEFLVEKLKNFETVDQNY